MNILLTGASGFIGGNLKSYLSDKYDLLTPSRYVLDLTNEEETKKYFSDNGIDFVIHCASVGGARGVPDKDTTVEDNLNMVNYILKYKNPKTRVILFGSGAMYDKSRHLKKIGENEIGEATPKDLYGKSKLLISKQIKDRTDTLMLNIFACYGYNELKSRFPTYAIERVLDGEDIVINQNVIFDYLFVEDMQKIVEYFVKNKPNENIINITPDKSISLSEIAKIVNGFADEKVDIKIKIKELNNEYTGSNSKLKKIFRDVTFTPPETGLKKLFDYIKAGRNK